MKFVNARIEERAAKAQAARHGGEGRWGQEDADLRPGFIVDERGEVVTYDEGSPTEEQTALIEANDPDYVLRDVAAKRRILARHRRRGATGSCVGNDDMCVGCGTQGEFDDPVTPHVDDCPELRDLAAIDADHPAYRQEWVPVPIIEPWWAQRA